MDKELKNGCNIKAHSSAKQANIKKIYFIKDIIGVYTDMKFCHGCGQQVLMTATVCPHCGTGQTPSVSQSPSRYQPAATPMSWSQLLFSFEGRISRSTYWIKFTLPLYALYLLAFMLDSSGTLFAIVVIAGIFPSLAVAVKRCHDRDRSALFLLLLIIPLISLWPAIELAFLRGTYGSNQFGHDPLA